MGPVDRGRWPLASLAAFLAALVVTAEATDKFPLRLQNDAVATSAASPPNIIPVLGKEQFDTAINADLVFVKFYSPRCPHCRAMAGAYIEMVC
jgi:protein-disulfide isomerase